MAPLQPWIVVHSSGMIERLATLDGRAIAELIPHVGLPGLSDPGGMRGARVRAQGVSGMLGLIGSFVNSIVRGVPAAAGIRHSGGPAHVHVRAGHRATVRARRSMNA